MKNNRFTKQLFGILASLLVVISPLLISATPVLAKPLESSIATTAKASQADDRLSSEFRHERDLFSRLKGDLSNEKRSLTQILAVPDDTEKSDLNLFSANRLAVLEAREQTLMNQDKALLAEIDGAQGMENTVQTLLLARSGFDKVEGVTNPGLAAETVKSINAYLTNMQLIVDHANTIMDKSNAGI